MIAQALVPVYNLPGINTPLILSGLTLTRIFMGNITQWNDPQILQGMEGPRHSFFCCQSLLLTLYNSDNMNNGDVNSLLPNASISVIYRSVPFTTPFSLFVPDTTPLPLFVHKSHHTFVSNIRPLPLCASDTHVHTERGIRIQSQSLCSTHLRNSLLQNGHILLVCTSLRHSVRVLHAFVCMCVCVNQTSDILSRYQHVATSNQVTPKLSASGHTVSFGVRSHR